MGLRMCFPAWDQVVKQYDRCGISYIIVLITVIAEIREHEDIVRSRHNVIITDITTPSHGRRINSTTF